MILEAIDGSILIALDDAILLDLGSTPPAPYANYTELPQGVSIALSLQSYNLLKTNGVYLCGFDYSLVTNYLSTGFFDGYVKVEDFKNTESLSGYFPPFSAYKISTNAFRVANNNIIDVKLPPVAKSYLDASFNIIVKNSGGYSKSRLYYPASFAPPPTPTPTPTPAVPSACLDNWSLANFTGTTFKNGDPIPQITDQEAWNTATGPGWCYFDNDLTYDTVYGKLYNWYAVTDARGLAPAGYHVPTVAEWEDLITCLGGSYIGGGYWSVAGAKMKTIGTFQDGDGLWDTPNVATNESGFSAVPAGCRTSGFINLHARGSFWVYDQITCINFRNGDPLVYIGSDAPTVGYSVRLKQGNP